MNRLKTEILTKPVHSDRYDAEWTTGTEHREPIAEPHSKALCRKCGGAGKIYGELNCAGVVICPDCDGLGYYWSWEDVPEPRRGLWRRITDWLRGGSK